MSKNIFIKMIISFVTVILIISIFCAQSSHAIGDMISEGKDFLEEGENPYALIKEETLKKASNDIYNVLLAFAIVIAVIVAMILGIQFMWASADEKAKVKEALMPFVTGCIVVFGSFTIWKFAVGLGNNAEGIIRYRGTSLDGQRLENHEQFERIENGEIASFTDREVKDAYTANGISDDLARWTKEKADPRANGNAVKGVDYGLTLDQAVNKLSSTKKIIYDEAKNRGLLANDGIYLKK